MSSFSPKAKGSAFERKVSQNLSLACSNMTRTDLFWRSSMSGGRYKKKNARVAAGDISALDPIGYPFVRIFVVECKCYRMVTFDAALYEKGPSFDMTKMWVETRKLAKKLKRLPMLVAKQDFRPPIVGVDLGGMRVLRRCWKGGMKSGVVRLVYPQISLSLMLFRDFLLGLDYKKMKKVSKEFPDVVPGNRRFALD